MPAARGLEQRHRQFSFQLLVHMAHLVIRGEQRQRMTVGRADELLKLAGQAFVRIVSCVCMPRDENTSRQFFA